MALSSPQAVPPGWYPDPSGARQWRVWTGTTWSDLTRPYGEPAVTIRRTPDLALAVALRRVVSFGLVGVLGGFSLLVGVLAHWPGTAQPVPQWYAATACSIGVALLVVGSAIYAFAVKELRGRWTIDAFIPGLNYFVVGVLGARRLGRPSGLRLVAELVLLALFASTYRTDIVVGLGPVIVALGQWLWLSVLVDQLAGPPVTSTPAASPPVVGPSTT